MATGKTAHQFCTLHRIGYNSELDPTCPQCSLAHIPSAPQLDWDVQRQAPLDDAGVLLDRRTLKPAA